MNKILSRDVGYCGMFIKNIKAKEILDSKGDPTVEAVLETNQGRFLASVPSGISTGKYEARELRDKDKGVKKACENIEKIIAPALRGEEVVQQDEIDSILIELDGTENKKRLGANAILAVSLAVCRAGAKAQKIPLWRHLAELSGNSELKVRPKLPIPCFLLVEGGKHGEIDSKIATQEFMVAMSKGGLGERMARVKKIYSFLKTKLKARVGKEGALAPIQSSAETVLEAIMDALGVLGTGFKEKLVLDLAASHFAKAGKYNFEGKKYRRDQLLDYYKKIMAKYPILGLEDPFGEEDWPGFKKTTKALGDKVLIIGDDLLVTNFELAAKAVKEGSCNAMVIKPNQVGTITETIGVANFAKNAGFKLFAKHRGGETQDSFLADLSVGLGVDYICAGGLLQKERLAKYRRLLEIEKELKNDILRLS